MRQRSVFDVVGPVMIGPSSSHTAGAVRLGNLARAIFGSTPSVAHIGLHGSFASTGMGHGTDLALVAGLLGLSPGDERIPDAPALAAQAGLDVKLSTVDLGHVHPNTAAFELFDAAGRSMRIVGSSVGGGDVVVTEIDGFEVEATGILPMLVVRHHDQPGEVAAVTRLLAEGDVNIAEMRVSRASKGGSALMLIETDAPVEQAIAEKIGCLPGVESARPVAAV